MLLTPQLESSNPASTAKSGMQARRRMHSGRRMHSECLMLYLPMVRLTVHYRYRAMIGLSLSLLSGIALRLHQLIVVFLSANFVSHRKRCHRSRNLLPARLPLSPVIAPLLSRPRLPAPFSLRSPGVL